MIKSFGDKTTERVFERRRVRKLGRNLQLLAQRKLVMLDAAESLADLRISPGNRLEKLSGNRKGQHSIRINEKWRICFRWREGNVYDVEITDYH